MTMRADMQADTVAIIGDWSEVFAVNRSSVVYDAERMPSVSWSRLGSFAGDWQPVSGGTARDESGFVNKSTGIIFAPSTAVVSENDQVTMTSGDVYYVNYVQTFEEHLEIYVRNQEGQN